MFQRLKRVSKNYWGKSKLNHTGFEVVNMLILKLILLALGITFSIFGYLIVCKKKYELINDFEARKKVGSRTDADAIRVGKIVLTLGAGLLVLFVLLMIFT